MLLFEKVFAINDLGRNLFSSSIVELLVSYMYWQVKI